MVSWRHNWLTMGPRHYVSDLCVVHDRLLHNRRDLQLLFRRHLVLRSDIKIAVVKLGASLLSSSEVAHQTGLELGQCWGGLGNAVVDLEALELLPAFPSTSSQSSQCAMPAARPQRESLQLSRFKVPWT